MINLKESILNYIKLKDTDYAFLITGEWGSGKTYFFKHTLIPEIEKTPISKNDDTKCYKVIYISLNGVSSFQDIYEQILSSTISRGKIVKKGFDVSKTIFSGVASRYLGEENYNKFIKEIFGKINIYDYLDLSGKVLCFDDLERISNKMNIDELFGFINTNFVEHKSVKTIFITNEDGFNKNNSEIYHSRKEKLIGRTIKYNLNIDITFKDLIKTYEVENKDYYNFLMQYKEYMLRVFADYSQRNLRTISFSFQLFQEIYFAIIKTDLEHFSKDILFFFLVIMFEFKEGKLTSADYNDPKGLSDIEMFKLSMEFRKTLAAQEEDENSEYLKTFYAKYLENSEYKFTFFDSIYKYILSGYFDLELFQEEINRLLKRDKPEWEQVFEKLNNYREMDEQDFINTRDLGINYIKQNKYDVYKYPYLCYIYLNLSEKELVFIPKKEIISILKDGINNSKKISAYNYDLESSIRFTETDDDEFKKFIKLILETINEIENESEQLEVEEFLECFFKEDCEFYLLYEPLKYKPIFNLHSIDDLFEKIVNAPNKKLLELIRIIRNRYLNTNNSQVLSQELKSLTVLNNKIATHISSINKLLNKSLLVEISEHIDKIINSNKTN